MERENHIPALATPRADMNGVSHRRRWIYPRQSIRLPRLRKGDSNRARGFKRYSSKDLTWGDTQTWGSTERYIVLVIAAVPKRTLQLVTCSDGSITLATVSRPTNEQK